MFSMEFSFVCLWVLFSPAHSSMSSFQTAQGHAFSQVVLHRRGSDRIYEMSFLFVAVGPNARFIVLPHTSDG